MTSCHEMKKGDIYRCTHCGLTVKVIQECQCNVHNCDPMDLSENCCHLPLQLQKGKRRPTFFLEKINTALVENRQ